MRFNNFDSRIFFLYLGPTPVFLKGPSVFVGPRNGTACGQRLAGRGLFLFRGDMELKVPTPSVLICSPGTSCDPGTEPDWGSLCGVGRDPRQWIVDLQCGI